MTERIDHAAEARSDLKYADEAIESGADDVASAIATIAQVHATLALVEQQRTANLIAIYVAEGAAESGFISKGFDFGHMADEIQEGLGL